MLVRRLGPEDWQVYRELRLEALEDSPDAFGATYAGEVCYSDAQWKERIEQGASINVAQPMTATEYGEFLGLAWGQLNSEDPTEANLFQMWVKPSARGRGVGRALVQAAVDWASTQGACKMVLWVTLNESPARRLYVRAGFSEVEEPTQLRTGSSLLCQKMQLDLAPRSRI